MKTLSFQVAEFDAPLDLILHLLSKHKLDILDVDISSLLEQYLAIIEDWKEENLDISSEFLEMASRLVYMKTVSLLPRHEEESKQLRADLAGELMEYSICKIAAELLRADNQYYDLFVRPPSEVEEDPTYTGQHSPDILYKALMDAIGKQPIPLTSEKFDSLVRRPVVSVTSKIFTVLRTLRRAHYITLDELFQQETERSALVATFLAVLELIKAGGITLDHNVLALAQSS